VNQPIVYFDGLCALCDGFVRFVVQRDRSRQFTFAPLQGTTARSNLKNEIPPGPLSTIILEIPGSRRVLRVKSDAALAIIIGLGGLWKLAALLRVFPRPFRDLVYDFIARHRYRWFGRREACRLPTPEEAGRFLP
jgi:predicted DCC family thiol-disulfide oxidoreductase YuxK